MNVTGLNQINSTDEEDQDGCEDNHMKLDNSDEDEDEVFSQNGSSLSK